VPASKKSDESHGSHRVQLTIAVGLVAFGVVMFLFLRGRSTLHELHVVLTDFTPARLPWLLVAGAAEVLSFWCYAMVQRRLLMEGGATLSRKSMVQLAIAATGLTNLVPGGTAPASGWLVSQYKRRGIPVSLGLWAVLIGGVAAAIAVLLLVAVGAMIAGLLGLPWGLVCVAALGAVGVLLVLGARQGTRVGHWLDRHRPGRFDDAWKRLSSRINDASRISISPLSGTAVFALSLANWGLDVVCLGAAFPFFGLAVPWKAVLFAYAVAQVAGSLAPVPGGIGFVEGGMIGAFALAGTPTGGAILATILYRIITSFGMAACGSLMLVVLARSKRPERATLTAAAKRLR